MLRISFFAYLIISALNFQTFAGQDSSYHGPQILPYGTLETHQDQGLVRDANGNIIDYWRIIDGNIVRIKKLRFADKTFDVLIIQQREGNLRSDGDRVAEATSTYVSWTPNIHTWMTKLRDDVYLSKYADWPDLIQLVKSETNTYNGLATSIIITSENDLSAIEVQARFVRRGNLPKNSTLDIEDANGFGPLPQVLEEKNKIVQGREVRMGDWGELKSLVKNPNSKYRLVPFIFMTLQDHFLFQFGARTYNDHGKIIPLGATHIVLDCMPQLVEYYEQYGFKVMQKKKIVKNKPDGSGSIEISMVQMGQSIEKLIKHNQQVIKTQSTHTGSAISNTVNQYRSEAPITGWNYLPVPSVDLKLNPSKSGILKDPLKSKLFFEMQQVPFYRSREYPLPEIDRLLKTRGMIQHPFDPFKRLGLDAEHPPIYWAQNSQDPRIVYIITNPGDFYDPEIRFYDNDEIYQIFGENNVLRIDDTPHGSDPTAEGDLQNWAIAREEVFGIPARTNPAMMTTELLPTIDPKTILKMYDSERKYGFADSRYDPSSVQSNPVQVAAQILKHPWDFYTELDWAISFALEHRNINSDLEEGLAYTLVSLLPNPIQGTERFKLDISNYQQEVKIQSNWINQIVLSYKKNPTSSQKAVETFTQCTILRPSSQEIIAEILTALDMKDPSIADKALKWGILNVNITKQVIEKLRKIPIFSKLFSEDESTNDQLVESLSLDRIFFSDHEPTYLGGYLSSHLEEARLKLDNFANFIRATDTDISLPSAEYPLSKYREEYLTPPKQILHFMSLLKESWPSLLKAFTRKYQHVLHLRLETTENATEINSCFSHLIELSESPR